MSKLINLTPHDIHIRGINNEIEIIPKTGIIARIKAKNIKGKKIHNFYTYKQIVEETIDLPEPQPDTFYIVSNVVLKSNWKRMDLIAPNTTIGAKKTIQGNIEYVESFIRN
ncbi:MAG: hypothetical protein ACRCW9_06070 [Cetobacterium sp.]